MPASGLIPQLESHHVSFPEVSVRLVCHSEVLFARYAVPDAGVSSVSVVGGDCLRRMCRAAVDSGSRALEGCARADRPVCARYQGRRLGISFSGQSGGTTGGIEEQTARALESLKVVALAAGLGMGGSIVAQCTKAQPTPVEQQVGIDAVLLRQRCDRRARLQTALHQIPLQRVAVPAPPVLDDSLVHVCI